MNILFLDAFVDSLSSFLFAVLLMLDGFVYSAISTLYNVYMILAKQRILTNEAFTVISNKVTMIIGVAMLFVLAYAILRAIIDPDQMTKGEMGGTKILKGILTCVFGLALTPVIFNLLYQGQDIILSNDIIGKMFFASEENVQSYEGFDIKDNDGNVIEHVEADSIKTNEYIDESAGNIVAIYMWQTFFYPDPSSELLAEEIEGNLQDYVSKPAESFIIGSLLGIGVYAAVAVAAATPLGWPALAISAIAGGIASTATSSLVGKIFTPDITMSLAEVMATVTYNGDFGMFQMFASNVAAGEIQYTFGLSTIAGLFACYAFVSFSIDMAVRAAKLAYYQIIAPIPLILQILPKFKKNFNKWISNIVSTFVEVFVRISVIYVVVYIISNLNTLVSSESLLWANEELPMAVGLFARAILIMGLIIFARRAPKMISETFGIDTGNMSLGLGKKLSEGGAFAVGATLGSVGTAGIRNLTSGIKNFRDQGSPATLSEGFRRVAGIGASTVAGAASAGLRTGSKAVYDHAHGRPMKTAREMVAEAGRGAEIATNRRDERARYRQEHGGTIDGVIKGHASDLVSSVVNWASGPVDTSYDDGFLSFSSKVQDLQASSRKVTEKDKRVKVIDRRMSELTNNPIGDYDEDAYTSAKVNKRDEINRKAENGEYISNSVKKDAYKFAVQKKEKELQQKLANGEIEAGEYDGKLKEIKNDLLSQYMDLSDTERYNTALTNAIGSVDKELYKYTAEQKSKLERERVEEIDRLKKARDVTQDAIFQEMLRSGDSDALKVVADFRAANAENLSKYGNTSLGRAIFENLGISANGSFDENIFSKGGNGITIKYKDGDNDAKLNYIIDSDGYYRSAKLNETTGVFEIDPSQDETLTYQELLDKANELKDFSIESQSSVGKTKKAAKDAANELLTSDEYIIRQARKRKQKDKK